MELGWGTELVNRLRIDNHREKTMRKEYEFGVKMAMVDAGLLPMEKVSSSASVIGGLSGAGVGGIGGALGGDYLRKVLQEKGTFDDMDVDDETLKRIGQWGGAGLGGLMGASAGSGIAREVFDD